MLFSSRIDKLQQNLHHGLDLLFVGQALKCPAAACLDLQQLPSVLSPSYSPLRPPADLCDLVCLFVFVPVIDVDDSVSNAVDNVGDGEEREEGELSCEFMTW